MRLLTTLGLFSTAIALASTVVAQPVGTIEEEFEFFEAGAMGYTMTGDSGEMFTLHKTPIMKWTNPARNNELGAVYLWFHNGSPRVVGSIFNFESRNGLVCTKHALHSLAPGPLTATTGGEVVWKPTPAGITWNTLDAKVAAAAQLRISQMRSLARKFEVSMAYSADRTESLRLLPQPLHRYESSSEMEGAIFAFASGTDPEALFLIETFQSGDMLKYRYGFARFHFRLLQAKLGEQVVWMAAEENDQMKNRIGKKEFQERIYSTMLVTERKPADAP